MARVATKKQRKFDVYAFKRKLKSLSPQEHIGWNNAVMEAAREEEHDLWKPNQSDFWSFLYILRCNGYYKIGITGNVSDRLNQINSGNPYEVVVVWAEKHQNAAEIEKKLHTKFKAKNIKREWFSLDECDIEEIKQFVRKHE